jgi:hypothetical protein
MLMFLIAASRNKPCACSIINQETGKEILMARLLWGIILICGLIIALAPDCVAANEKPEDAGNAPVVIKGVVYDELTNEPIPNLGIYSNSSGHKVTDSNSKGEFVYPVPEGKDIIQILPWSPKHVGRSTYVNVSECKDRIITLYVEHGTSVDVYVKDEKGQPIEKASVLWMCAGGASGKTDKNGKVTLTQVSRFRDGCLTVKAPGYETGGKSEVYAPVYANGGITVTLNKLPAQQDTTDNPAKSNQPSR